MKAADIRSLALAACAAALGACSTMQYAVDDGRSVDEALLADIRAYGKATQTLRPAIVRSAALRAPACEPAWELPFEIASSDDMDEDDKVAWVRALRVDERLTVVAAAAPSPLAVGDRIVDIDGYRSESGRKMTAALHERRDDGKPFRVTTAAGRKLLVEPVRVCRGHVRAAAPTAPTRQDYHWGYSVHPLDVFRQDITPDEALWLVLWTQGLSEEGGARMKAYQYGAVPAQVVAGVASFLAGIGPLAKAAAAGTSAAASQAGVAVVKNVVAGQALGYAQEQAASMMEASSKNRASLDGVSWVGGTVFDKADKWAFDAMRQLGADPLAAFSLHRKLIAAGSADNAFVLDAERPVGDPVAVERVMRLVEDHPVRHPEAPAPLPEELEPR
ncbi:MAG: hypothetical protein HZC24_05690, partial [Rhodocyclales bacterium]|nr:hypothetical protein [Rhodocyclales bacterium]